MKKKPHAQSAKETSREGNRPVDAVSDITYVPLTCGLTNRKIASDKSRTEIGQSAGLPTATLDDRAAFPWTFKVFEFKPFPSLR